MSDEALRALEKKWRDMANDRANAEWVTLVNCANDLRDILLSDRQEVAPVAGPGPCEHGKNHDWRGDGICEGCGADYTEALQASAYMYRQTLEAILQVGVRNFGYGPERTTTGEGHAVCVDLAKAAIDAQPVQVLTWSDALNGRGPVPAPTSPAQASEARDAARYRWIRDQQATITYKRKDYGVWHPLVDAYGTSEHCESLDAAIDAAMEKSR